MSPFKSGKQLRFLAAKEPKVFEAWKEKYGVPKKVKKELKKKTMKRNGGGVVR